MDPRLHARAATFRNQDKAAAGSVVALLGEDSGEYETIRRRPLLYGINFLHLNPEGWWLAFADVFAGGLILLTVTGVIIPAGRRGLAGSGGWLLALGILAPLAALVAI